MTELPDLPPDLSFPRLARDAAALRFAFEVKRAAMGPHITARWGWDEAFQLDFHRRRFAELPLRAIALEGRPVGTLAVTEAADHLRLDEFYLLPEVQRRGLGTRILRHLGGIADVSGLPIRLRHLAWNPVGALYEREGFRVTGETESHREMERPPAR
jgi:GNAT superfamily N-acetyltransferase